MGKLEADANPTSRDGLQIQGLPALIVFVVITATALCLVNPDPGLMLGVGWRSLFGVSNLILHKLAVEYFRPAIGLNPFAHTWSLGVEEQFYLLFPLLVWLSGFARFGLEEERARRARAGAPGATAAARCRRRCCRSRRTRRSSCRHAAGSGAASCRHWSRS